MPGLLSQENRQALARGLLDTTQAASNNAASTVAAPVDALAWALRKFGAPIPQAPFGGSDWMKAQGLMRDVQSPYANAVGETLGGVLPIVAAAKGPQIAAGLLKMGENAAARTPMNAATGNQTGAIVWHGSPYKFDRFDASKIGTGEGAQAYGMGHYAAEAQATAQSYKDTLRGLRTDTQSVVRDLMPDRHFTTKERAEIFRAAFDEGTSVDKAARQLGNRQASIRDVPNDVLLEAVKRVREDAQGYLYKVDLPDDQIAKMLDWDKPLSQQAPNVQKLAGVKQRDMAAEDALIARAQALGVPVTSLSEYAQLEKLMDKAGKQSRMTGRDLYERFGGAATGADKMRAAGIPGIRYLDGGSRGAGAGSSNFVVFPGNEGLLNILERNGQPIR
jgi:hypothetical protein